MISIGNIQIAFKLIFRIIEKENELKNLKREL